MVRRRKRSVRFGVAIACTVVTLTAYVVLRASRSGRTRRTLLPPECNLGPTTAGIDVSYYQGDITWSRVHRAGVEFAFIRVADGMDILDSKFEANWNGARRAGVLRGAYQFFR